MECYNAMKGYFLYGEMKLDDKQNLNGIDKKVKSQILSLNTKNIKCTQLCFPREIYNLWYKLKIRCPFFNLGPKWIYYSEFDDMDFLYFRRPQFFSGYLIKLLKIIKKNNPNAKILLESPTYPYDKELKVRWIDYFFFLKDKMNRNKLYRYVDRLVTMDDSNVIFKIPTIKIMNGINVTDIAVVESSREDRDTIHIIMVAMFSVWHGVDRFLKGLGIYYQNGGRRNIVLHLVGKINGGLMREYIHIINKYFINNHVIFHGEVYGQELDFIYNKCRLGLVSFGTHRKNIFKLSTLKSREYLAKGLPMISSGQTDVFERTNFQYNLECPSDESPIDMEKVISFFDEIYRDDVAVVVDRIRRFALENIDIHVTMLPVIDYLKS